MRITFEELRGTDRRPEAKNVIQLEKAKRAGSLDLKRRTYKDCVHSRHKALITEASREVECSGCHAKLDPFQVLVDLANGQRLYLEELDAWDDLRLSRLSDRYDAEWQEEKSLGRIVDPPPDGSREREVWDVFRAYLGKRFTGMYRRKGRLRSGPEWYGTIPNGAVSFEFARQQLRETEWEKAKRSRRGPE